MKKRLVLKKKAPAPVINVRVEYGEGNIASTTLPQSAPRSEWKARIKEKYKNAKRAFLLKPDAEVEEIITFATSVRKLHLIQEERKLPRADQGAWDAAAKEAAIANA